MQTKYDSGLHSPEDQMIEELRIIKKLLKREYPEITEYSSEGEMLAYVGEILKKLIEISGEGYEPNNEDYVEAIKSVFTHREEINRILKVYSDLVNEKQREKTSHAIDKDFTKNPYFRKKALELLKKRPDVMRGKRKERIDYASLARILYVHEEQEF